MKITDNALRELRGNLMSALDSGLSDGAIEEIKWEGETLVATMAKYEDYFELDEGDFIPEVASIKSVRVTVEILM